MPVELFTFLLVEKVKLLKLFTSPESEPYQGPSLSNFEIVAIGEDGHSTPSVQGCGAERGSAPKEANEWIN